jgi:hypothetical protein
LRAETDRGVEIKPIGKAGGSNGNGLLSALNGGPVPLPLSLRAISVGRSSFPGDREVIYDDCKLINLPFGQAVEIEDLLIGKQFEMEKCHIK